MAIIAHWASLEEANKLTQSTLLAGIIQEVWEEGQMLRRLPVTQINTPSLKWNREKNLPAADFIGELEQIPWRSDVEYGDQVEVGLTRVVRQDALDNLRASTYKTPNDYRAVMISQQAKGCMRTIEDNLIYGDRRVNAKEFDGYHALVATTMTIDGGETALKMTGPTSFRALEELVKPRPDFYLMARAIHNRISDAATFGINTGGTNVYVGSSGIAWGVDSFGMRVPSYGGVPMLYSDYMVAEQANTGAVATTRNARSKYVSGTKQYTIFAMRLGPIEDGGVNLIIGDGTGGPQFFKTVEFAVLEDFDAGGVRLVAYTAQANGSTRSLGAIMDITDAAPTLT